MAGPIVVGVDGSKESVGALRFAVQEAALGDNGVLMVYAAEAPTVFDEGKLVFAEAAEQAFGDAEPPVPVERRVDGRSPAQALVDVAAEADLLVVGSRGRGGFAGLLLGSVSQQVAHHAPCPVAIVRAAPADHVARVLVGVDGSEESRVALRWADEEARLRGTPLVALHAWAPPFEVGPGLMPAPLPVDELQGDAEAFFAAVVAETLGEERAAEVERRLVEIPAAAGLSRAASADDLLVVGSRGRGGFAGLLLGSVSQQVAHHAPCPVVIVREPS